MSDFFSTSYFDGSHICSPLSYMLSLLKVPNKDQLNFTKQYQGISFLLKFPPFYEEFIYSAVCKRTSMTACLFVMKLFQVDPSVALIVSSIELNLRHLINSMYIFLASQKFYELPSMLQNLVKTSCNMSCGV